MGISISRNEIMIDKKTQPTHDLKMVERVGTNSSQWHNCRLEWQLKWQRWLCDRTCQDYSCNAEAPTGPKIRSAKILAVAGVPLSLCSEQTQK